MTIDDNSVPTEQKLGVKLSKQEYDILIELIQERIKDNEYNSIESIIKRATEYKKFALLKYPKEKIEIYVDKKTKKIHIDFLNNQWCAQKYIAFCNEFDLYNKNENGVLETSERIYIG